MRCPPGKHLLRQGGPRCVTLKDVQALGETKPLARDKSRCGPGFRQYIAGYCTRSKGAKKLPRPQRNDEEMENLMIYEDALYKS